MSKIAIVTDSTGPIPKEMIGDHKILFGSQVVIFGEKIYRDGIDITPTEFYQRLESGGIHPTTSQVAVSDFVDLFTQLHNAGYEILCMIVSHKLSGTLNSITQAKKQIPQATIEVVDTLSIAMAMGFQVMAVARAIADGATLAEAKALAEGAREYTGLFITPRTLEYLHRGGRIGGATRFLGTALNIKPIIEVRDGRLEPIERVRTRKKVMRRLVELIEEKIAGRTPVRLSAVHANSPEEAQALLDMASKRLNPVDAVLTDVSPAVGVHVGPGTIGLAFMAGL